MKSILKILILIFFTPNICWSQLVVDSLQEYEIRYFYEQIYSDSDFESFNNHLMSNAKTENDSLRIMRHINKLEEIQQVKIDNDTTQLCQVLFAGEPVDFRIEIDGKEIEFEKSDFAKIRIVDDYPHYENQCIIASFDRSNNVLKAKFKSNKLNFDFNINLSYPWIRIENNTNISLSGITIKSNPEDGIPTPIPIENIVIEKGAVEIKHNLSN